MKVSFDATQMTIEQQFARAMPRKLRAKVWATIRVVSFDAERNIKIRMPVDTGRARASWGHSSAPALAGEGIWEEDVQSLSLTQGSRVEYIEYLNEGHSKQAPAGFIDAVQRQATEQLENLLGGDVEEVFR